MRMWLCLAAIVAVGLVVLGQLGLPETARAGWYEMAMTFIGVAMCCGGVEAARWMLRESPMASVATPKSDWVKLWMWSGIPGGFLMLFWLLSGWLCSSLLSSQLMIIIIGLALMGPAIWMISVPWMLKELYTSYRTGVSAITAALVAGGGTLHLFGALFAFYVFPHFSGKSLHSLFSLLSALSSYYALAFCHLLLIGCLCYAAHLFARMFGKKRL